MQAIAPFALAFVAEGASDAPVLAVTPPFAAISFIGFAAMRRPKNSTGRIKRSCDRMPPERAAFCSLHALGAGVLSRITAVVPAVIEVVVVEVIRILIVLHILAAAVVEQAMAVAAGVVRRR